MQIEYRVRPVTRFIVTRYMESECGGSCETKGEFGGADVAYQVGYALAKEEAARLGLPPGDTTVMFPQLPVGEPPFSPPPLANGRPDVN